LAYYPEAAEELKKTIPGLQDIENAGKELLSKIEKQ
jgi:carbon monoxide dehydrogenase subunit G